MKRILYTLVTLAGTIGFTACKDFLEEKPQDRLVESNAFETPADAEAVVAGVYAKFLRNTDIFFDYPAWRTLEWTSNQYVGNNGLSDYDRHTYTSEDGDLRQMWQGLYEVVSRANIAIDNLKKMENLSNKEAMIAEAKFCRAYAYFLLVNMFGDVPLRLEPVVSAGPAQVQMAATPAQDIYQQVIIPDLQEGATALPAWRSEAQNKYRVTSITALAMLARVYLYTEDWQNAMQTAEKAWTDGLAAGYGLFDNYMHTWTANTEHGKEHLFSLSYAQGHSSNFLLRRADPADNPVTKFEGWGNDKFVEPRFYAKWPNDFRKLSAAPGIYLKANGDTTRFSTGKGHIAKWWDPTVTDGWGYNNLNLIRFAEVYLTYAEAANEALGGPNPKAIEAINTIRRRARNFYTLDYSGGGVLKTANKPVPGLEDISTTSLVSQAAFRDLVYNERDWELFGEFHARLENVRRHRLAAKGAIAPNYLLSNVLSEYGTNVNNEVHHLFPKPLNEIRFNPLLQQNFGY